jgi:hypothetical protein
MCVPSLLATRASSAPRAGIVACTVAGMAALAAAASVPSWSQAVEPFTVEVAKRRLTAALEQSFGPSIRVEIGDVRIRGVTFDAEDITVRDAAGAPVARVARLTADRHADGTLAVVLSWWRWCAIRRAASSISPATARSPAAPR